MTDASDKVIEVVNIIREARSTCVWNESADINVCPFSKYFIVIVSRLSLTFKSCTKTQRRLPVLHHLGVRMAQEYEGVPKPLEQPHKVLFGQGALLWDARQFKQDLGCDGGCLNHLYPSQCPG